MQLMMMIQFYNNISMILLSLSKYSRMNNSVETSYHNYWVIVAINMFDCFLSVFVGGLRLFLRLFNYIIVGHKH